MLKVQTKTNLVIIPLLLLAIFGIGLWSIGESVSVLRKYILFYIESVLDTYVRENPERLQNLLEKNRLDTVGSFVQNYRQQALESAQDLVIREKAHLFALTGNGEWVFRIDFYKNDLSIEKWPELAAKIASGTDSVENGIFDGHLFVYRYFEPWDWVIFVTYSNQDVRDNIRRIAVVTLLIAFIASAAAAVILTLFLRKTILRPVYILGEMASNITANRFPAEIPVKSNDEIGVLAQSMQEMSRTLEEYVRRQAEWQQTLEEKVSQKTRELRSANAKLTREIREKQHVQTELENSLADKEILLREIHHRVKNNLSIIMSLLQFQFDATEDWNVKTILGQMQNRIYSMTLIHQMLYATDNISSLNFRDYGIQLLEQIRESCLAARGNIEIIDRIEDRLMHINEVKTCGLIITELVTNALKYAFPDGKPGTITVVFKELEPEKHLLSVKDNGIGFDRELFNRESKSLGFFLVRNLVEELKGNIDISTEKGTEISIRFRLVSSETI